MTKATYKTKKLFGLVGPEVGMHGRSSGHGNLKKLRAHTVNHQHKTEVG